MKILFLDQSSQIGGAELSLLDIASAYRDNCLVSLFEAGPYGHLLDQHHIPVQILPHYPLKARKNSNFWQSLDNIKPLLQMATQVAQLSQQYDLIYANTQKALVVGAIASWLSHRPLVYHLRDILSADHFSSFNRRLLVSLANRFASKVITNSRATQAAFGSAGGRLELTSVIYNGFNPMQYQNLAAKRAQIQQQYDLQGHFVVGHFSRLSPWKGQHVLIEALTQCPFNTIALLVGDALFGEQAYVQQLHQQVKALGLESRVRFLGFQADIPAIMSTCDLIAHTSVAPEPFGRVIVEGMLCGKPVMATAAGGAIELITHDETGWLIPPGDAQQLASMINRCHHDPHKAVTIGKQAQQVATQRFHRQTMQQQIDQLLQQVMSQNRPVAKSPRFRQMYS
jgi:glycosyltransferase involved in cell wall biosynthesis